MKEKFILVAEKENSYLIRYTKKHWWSEWKQEMDGDKVKKYPVDQENCVHQMTYVGLSPTTYGSLIGIYRCTKCGREQAGCDRLPGWKYEEGGRI